MDDQKQKHRLVWRGVEIDIEYAPERFGLMSHLELRVAGPKGAMLPVTKTGYRSHFIEPGTVENFEEGVIGYVTAWLDEAALSKEWQKQQIRLQQSELF